MSRNCKTRSDTSFSRRGFLKTGGALVTGGALSLGTGDALAQDKEETKAVSKIVRYRTLGKTGFKVSDISIGAAGTTDPDVIRHAYDHGINYFDTAETYSNGASETAIGLAMEHMDRSKIFITTKLQISPEASETQLRDRFMECLTRLKTDYVDSLFTHSVGLAIDVNQAGYHSLVKKLQAEGKLRYSGISNHGPRDETQDSMEKVLCAAAEDGRFDVMLLSYNFLNTEEAENVLACCKKKNIGTTAMKVVPGYLVIEPWDPENPAPDYADYIERAAGQGLTREQAIERIVNWIAGQQETIEQIKPFAEKYGVTTNETLGDACVQWVLKNPDMHTVCVSMPTFESIDLALPLSGTELTGQNMEFLEDYKYAFGSRYCRHGCSACASSCSQSTAVSTIMRYSQYFVRQGREKLAMKKYATLGELNAESCLTCKADCAGSCPFGVSIQSNMVKAHSLLTML